MNSRTRKAIEILKIPPQWRNQEQINQLAKATQSVRFFQELTQRDGNQLLHLQCCKVMSLQEFDKGKYVLKYGQLGDAFYIVLSGKLSVQVPTVKIDQEHPEFPNFQHPKTFKQATQIGPGGSFGDFALTKSEFRQASILCIQKTTLAVLDAKDFKIIQKTYLKNLNEKIQFLRSLPSFKGWTLVSLQKFSYCLQILKLNKNQTLFYQGSPAKQVFIVKSGQFKLTKIHYPKNGRKYIMQKIPNILSSPKKKRRNAKTRNLRRSMQVTVLGAKEIIGIQQVLKKPPVREFTCTCVSSKGEVLVMTDKDFNMKMQHPETSKYIEQFREIHSK